MRFRCCSARPRPQKAVAEAPETVNADAYANWLYKLKPDNAGDLAKLLDAAAYTKLARES